MRFLTFWKYLGLLWMVLLAHHSLSAKHLVGGDFTYRCLGEDPNGDNLYEVTMTVYRDCQLDANGNPNTPFDDTVRIAIYDNANLLLVETLAIPLTDSSFLELTSADTCVPPPTNLCYIEGNYISTVALPDNPNGYTLAWGRCCRNATIQNIIDPVDQGMVLSAYIPSTDLCNSSPSFNNALPTYICLNDSFQFDHSALDPDGDSLVYRLTVPFTAGSPNDVVPIPIPPYDTVTWAPGFSTDVMLPGNPPLTIDPMTGQLIVLPEQLGQYVFSVSVFEYRNGVFIGEVKRDIQINVIDCPINFPPEIEFPDTLTRNDTLLFRRGQETCFEFQITDNNGLGAPIDSISINFEGMLFDPPFGATFTLDSAQSPATATLCWTPPCELDQLPDDQMIIQAIDNNDCPGPNITSDTLTILVIEADPPPPQLQCVQRIAPDSVEIRWEPIQENDRPGFLNYTLFRITDNFPLLVQVITDVELDSTRVQIPANLPDSLVCFQMVTTKICGNQVTGGPSTSVCITEDSISMCRVTVDTTSDGILVEWEPTGIGTTYTILRSDQISGPFSTVGESFGASFLDTTAETSSQTYCYRISSQNGCGDPIESSSHCSILMEIEQNGSNGTQLNWSPYFGWEQGVSAYEIWSFPPDGAPTLVDEVGGSTFEYFDETDREPQAGLFCYRIRAISNPGGCAEDSWSNEACVAFEPQIFAPNAFTPNNDGINDFFEVKGDFFETYSIQIFNRWGQKIFESQNISDPWDGRDQGSNRASPQGVYMFRIEATGLNGETASLSGSVTLIR
ncbi:gliding motility-associated C-terminal domain-containing protein [Pontibacter sp. G13]|uniref:gliding motility-associated C-terminal domain-containing protein n=1 Tax=Pontibacter sp. G13 TaxID=3074898 RepID=UPI002888FB1F|nr:gliding motility-associated C-terminal domain-containing protein [Pontibacter sp. G13]WNJ21224.1 gliding motility-associated C-terminal domain-containing protein [Pontibacter sp. G13]